MLADVSLAVFVSGWVVLIICCIVTIGALGGFK
jgi:hypothetical protein